MNDALQIAAVVFIEALALVFLISRFVRFRRPRVLTKPDVPASRLVRKKR